MSAFSVLVVVGIGQATLCVLTVMLLLFNRERQRRRVDRMREGVASVGAPLRRWVVEGHGLDEVAASLRLLPPQLALDQASSAVTRQLPLTQQRELASALCGELWVHRILALETSSRWWQRLEAARMLSVVGGPEDDRTLHRLLRDRHPAVRVAAASCLPRLATALHVARVLDMLHNESSAVRAYQYNVLRQVWSLAEPRLLERLTPEARPERLVVWINLAEVIASPRCLAIVAVLSTHADPLVRLAVARALKLYYHPGAQPRLLVLLQDTDWRVRAQAARALGCLDAVDAVAPLTARLGDSSWWVRFRSALALAALGETGRQALRDARLLPDRYAAEMATMVSGLSTSNVVELSDG